MKKANIELIMVCAGSQGPADKAHVPIGLVYIGSELERHGYSVKIWHLLPEELEGALNSIKAREPLWVGLSVLSGMTTLYAAQYSRRIRQEIPRTAIVWGGHHASAVPEECIKEDYVDIVVKGEGEDTAVEMSDMLLKGGDLSQVKGLVYKNGQGKTILNPERPLVDDIDKYDLNWDLIDLRKYRIRNRHGQIPINFYSSRGCPYKCTFCATPMYTGSSFRAHSPDYVARHLQHLSSSYGFNTVFFSDDNFMIDARRGMEVIRRVVRQGVSVGSLDVRLNQMTNSMVADFETFGVSGVFFGYESGNQRVLKLLNKGLTVELMKEKAKLLSHHKITVWASGFLGAPTETREEMNQTLDFAIWMRDHLADGSTVSTYRYMPLPKTKLIDLAVREGFRYPENSEDWKRIDPIGPYYEMKSWIKWLTEEDEKQFALFQELSRNGMLNYSSKEPFIVNKINNFFVSRVRARLTKRSLRNDFEVKFFNKLRIAYGYVRYRRRMGLHSQAQLD